MTVFISSGDLEVLGIDADEGDSAH